MASSSGARILHIKTEEFLLDVVNKLDREHLRLMNTNSPVGRGIDFIKLQGRENIALDGAKKLFSKDIMTKLKDICPCLKNLWIQFNVNIVDYEVNFLKFCYFDLFLHIFLTFYA